MFRQNRLLLISTLAAVFFWMSFTAFQCGSAEMTTARLAIQQKQWQKAEESVQKELAKNDKNEEAWFLLGEIRYEMRKWPQMVEAFDRALALAPTHKGQIATYRLKVWGDHYKDGVDFYNRGRDTAVYYDSAIVKFQTATLAVPESSATFYVLGLTYLYGKQDYQKALSSLEKALAINPKYTEAAARAGDAHMLMAQRHVDAKDEAQAAQAYAKAIPFYETAVQLEPTNKDNVNRLLEAYDRAKQSDKAMALVQGSVEKDPANLEYRLIYGVYLLQKDMFKESVEQFQKALEINPDHADAVYNLGVAFLNWGVELKKVSDEKAEAEAKAGKKSRDIKPDITYREKFNQALPYLEKAVQARADDAALWQRLGSLYTNMNRQKDAERAFQESDRIAKQK